MQDRYAGDIGDYGKFALLRLIQLQGLSVGVNWYRVDALDSEKNKDGSFRQKDGKYLISDKLKVCDQSLAERLMTIADGQDRSIIGLEKEGLIPGAVYYHEKVTVSGRTEWHSGGLEKLKGAQIVFLDPDNGLLVKSVGKGSARSVKYTFYEEVRDYIGQNQSVLVYNHRCRKPKKQYFQNICEKLQAFTDVSESQILKITFPKGSVKDYLFIPASNEHYEKVKAAFLMIEQSIWGQMGMCRIPK